MTDLCHKQGCNSLGTKFCGACVEASYCSAECQKEDWKLHKHSCRCVDIKKLPTTSLPLSLFKEYMKKFKAAAGVLNHQANFAGALQVMQKALVFAEIQLGVNVEGTSQWRRSDGAVSNGDILLLDIRISIAKSHYMVRDLVTAIACHKKVLQLLELRDKSDNSNLLLFVDTEQSLSICCSENKQFDEAQYHCEQCLMFAKLVTGEDQVPSERKALTNFARLRGQQSLVSEAIDFYEKAYILVSTAYGPVHREVQLAAGELTDCLIYLEDYSRAEGYSRMNLEILIDPSNGMDQEGTEVADAMMHIASLWLQKDPVEDEKAAIALANEAEVFSRKSCRLFDKRRGPSPNDSKLVRYFSVFGEILLKREKFTEETRIVLERSLTLSNMQGNRFGSSDLMDSLGRLVEFHGAMSATAQSVDARNREMRLCEKYKKEFFILENSCT